MNIISDTSTTEKQIAAMRIEEHECLERLEREHGEAARLQQKKDESDAYIRWWEERTSLAWWMFGRTDYHAREVTEGILVKTFGLGMFIAGFAIIISVFAYEAWNRAR